MTSPDLDLEGSRSAPRSRPGVYEVELGEIDPGRLRDPRLPDAAGLAALGRTLGLVAPTPPEYRVLGTNEPFLATLRSATAGRAIERPSDPWIHDLTTERASTDLWPRSSCSPCSSGRSTSPCAGLGRAARARRRAALAGRWLATVGGAADDRGRRDAGGRDRAAGSAAARRCCRRTTRPAVAAPPVAAGAMRPTPIAVAPRPRCGPPRRPRRARRRSEAAPAPAAPRRSRRGDTLRASATRSGGPASADGHRHPLRGAVYPPADVPDRPAPGFDASRSRLVSASPSSVGAVRHDLAHAARAHPGDFGEIAGEIVQRGIQVSHVVSGDAAAGRRTSRRRRSRSTPSASTRRRRPDLRLHLQEPGRYERLRSTVDDCARSYVTDPRPTSRSRPRPTSCPPRGRGASSSRRTCGRDHRGCRHRRLTSTAPTGPLRPDRCDGRHHRLRAVRTTGPRGPSARRSIVGA
jgi:hypothetical protein